MADQLCTSTDVKLQAKITDALDDTFISALIDRCSAFIETYTGRKLVPEAGVTYVFDTEFGWSLMVPRGLRAITSMGVASTHQPDSGGTYTTVTAADRLLRPKAGDLPVGWPPTEVRISRAATSVARFTDAENGCTITGDWGFAATPDDVKQVCIDAVVAAYAHRRDGASSVIGADAAASVPWSLYFGPGSPQRATLDRYAYTAIT